MAARVFNLLDTPGHEDFSEDTYRTLTAVDSAVMVIDAAKGIEAQTRKLFEVCRLRDVPIITFINKMDREGRDPFELLDEIADDAGARRRADELADRHGPATSRACYDLAAQPHAAVRRRARSTARPHRRRLDRRTAASRRRPSSREEVELVRAGYPAFDLEAYRDGHLTPVFFGSALQQFRRARAARRARRLRAAAAAAAGRAARRSSPTEPKVTGFVFKVQANMDPNHRDRIAFLRLCSGTFQRGMKLTQIGHRQGAGGQLADPVLRPRPRARRRGLARRHHRHPQPRHAAGRRHADRGRDARASPASPTSRRKSCAACGWRIR